MYERMKEHWGAYRSKKGDSHMFVHHQNEHGATEEPKFQVRAVKYYKTALTRQIGEAVRIRRRGGAGMILNSKSEFDRCKIPRLVIEEQEEIEKLEKLEAEKLQERMTTLDLEEEAWGAEKIVSRNN